MTARADGEQTTCGREVCSKHEKFRHWSLSEVMLWIAASGTCVSRHTREGQYPTERTGKDDSSNSTGTIVILLTYRPNYHSSNRSMSNFLIFLWWVW
jgi:hypothetical protein